MPDEDATRRFYEACTAAIQRAIPKEPSHDIVQELERIAAANPVATKCIEKVLAKRKKEIARAELKAKKIAKRRAEIETELLSGISKPTIRQWWAAKVAARRKAEFENAKNRTERDRMSLQIFVALAERAIASE
jgi:hypothetical protein